MQPPDGIQARHWQAARPRIPSPTAFLVLAVAGDLIQQGVTQSDFSVLGAILAVTTFGFWAATLAWVTYLSPRMEELLDGRPLVVIRDDQILKDNM